MEKNEFQKYESQLLNKCFGDHEQMNRLVQFEKDKDAGITTLEAIKRAIERHNRDNS